MLDKFLRKFTNQKKLSGKVFISYSLVNRTSTIFYCIYELEGFDTLPHGTCLY